MAFDDLSVDSNQTAYKLGLEIYKELQKQYPDKTTEHLDLILNSLCMALICLIHQNVDKEDRPVMIQLVHKILTKNC